MSAYDKAMDNWLLNTSDLGEDKIILKWKRKKYGPGLLSLGSRALSTYSKQIKMSWISAGRTLYHLVTTPESVSISHKWFSIPSLNGDSGPHKTNITEKQIKFR